MTRHRMLARRMVTQLSLRFLIALMGLMLICGALTVLFMLEWHRRLWIRSEEHLAIERPLSGFLVPPNELRSFSVTQELIALSVRQRQFQQRYERPPCKESVVGLRLRHSEWGEDGRSSRGGFYLLLWPPLAREPCIQRMERNV